MDSSQLMIGSYVMRDGNIVRVAKLIIGGLSTDHDTKVLHESMFEPVPITPDLLGKCPQFRAAKENAGNLDCFKFDHITIALWIGGKWQAWYKTTDFRKSPQHLHELQRLVLALTGKQLEVVL